MHEIEFLGGTSIDDAARRLAAAAQEHGEARGRFNDIPLVANRLSTADAIVAAYQRDIEASAKRWRESTEGIALAEANAAEIVRLRAKARELMARLPALDFSDKVAVLDWLGELQPCSDRIGVNVEPLPVVLAFDAHGFTPNMNCGLAFDHNDAEVYFGWLVGQALDGLTHGPAIHGIFHKFAAEWKAKWGANAAAVS